ncbi:MAG: hypothetical protein WKF91_12865 [Segetibacter sp.]
MFLGIHSITLEEAKALQMAANQLLEEAEAEEKRLFEKKPLQRVKLVLKQVTDRFNLVIGSKR